MAPGSASGRPPGTDGRNGMKATTDVLPEGEGTRRVAMRRAVGSLAGRGGAAEVLGYTRKRRLLGKPLINEQLSEQRLSKRLALGVLSAEGISSSALGTEENLIGLRRGGVP